MFLCLVNRQIWECSFFPIFKIEKLKKNVFDFLFILNDDVE